MNWYHQSDPLWMKARKDVLTASDIMKMLPTTPTGRDRSADAIQSAILEVWADKQSEVQLSDTISYNSAGRGHILEPYAIQEFNKSCVISERLYHWDDVVIHDGATGYSPDGLSTPFGGGIVNLHRSNVEASTSAEVKCYAAKKHYAIASLNKHVLEERWQIATGMYVSPSIEDSFLILYNPSCEHKLFYHYYDRVLLEPELLVIQKIVDNYYLETSTFHEVYDDLVLPSYLSEEDIIKELAKASSLNP